MNCIGPAAAMAWSRCVSAEDRASRRCSSDCRRAAVDLRRTKGRDGAKEADREAYTAPSLACPDGSRSGVGPLALRRGTLGGDGPVLLTYPQPLPAKLPPP